jgi:hypothetical protein
MINKESSAENIVAYIGYHALAGLGLGAIEAILIGGLPSREGKLRNLAKWSLVNMTSAASLAGVQALVVKYTDADIDFDWLNKYLTPLVFVIPLMFLNKASASRVTTRLFQVSINDPDQNMKAAARNALDSRSTIISINNSGGNVAQALGLREKWIIGTFNYLYMVGITSLVDHFI